MWGSSVEAAPRRGARRDHVWCGSSRCGSAVSVRDVPAVGLRRGRQSIGPGLIRIRFQSLESRSAVGELRRFAAGQAQTWSRSRWPGVRSPAHARGAPDSGRRRRAINTVCSCAGRGHREWCLRPYPEPPARAPGWRAKAWYATAAALPPRRRQAERARPDGFGSTGAARCTKFASRRPTRS